MRIYDFVAQHCREAGVSPDTSEVQKIVGTLVASGFDYDLSDHDAEVGREVVLDLIKRHATLRVGKVMVNDNGRAKPGSTGVVSSMDANDRFVEIEACLDKGHCPRCKTQMMKVKLGSFAPATKEFLAANYCKSCKTTLWVK